MSKHTPPLTKEEKNSIFWSVAIGLIGFILAIALCCPEIFQRFGALIVCVGIYSSIKALPLTIDQGLKVLRPIFDKTQKDIKENLKKSLPGTVTQEVIEKEFDVPVSNIRNELEKSTYELKKRILKIEGCILIIGTVIWGFGDLFVPEVTYFIERLNIEPCWIF